MALNLKQAPQNLSACWVFNVECQCHLATTLQTVQSYKVTNCTQTLSSCLGSKKSVLQVAGYMKWNVIEFFTQSSWMRHDLHQVGNSTAKMSNINNSQNPQVLCMKCGVEIVPVCFGAAVAAPKQIGTIPTPHSGQLQLSHNRGR